MRTKRISFDELLSMILECRRSGLTDYQWCRENNIKPGTFDSVKIVSQIQF